MKTTRPLCYCFDFSYEDVEEEVAAGKPDEIRQAIVDRCRQGLARCAETNPRGTCCLTDVRDAYSAARSHAQLAVSEAGDPNGADCCAAPASPSTPSLATSGRSRITLGAALLAAAGSSACCWLPLGLALAGVSVAGVGSTFEMLRPYLVGVSSLLLLVSFYLLFVRPRRCEPGAECAIAPGRTTGLQRALFGGALVACLGFVFFPNYGLGLLTTEKEGLSQSAGSPGDVRVFEVSGMTCAGCAAGLSANLSEIPGVLAVEVDYESSRAWLRIPTQAGDTAVLEAIAQAGFEAARVE